MALMIVWPEWMTRAYLEMIVLENLASWFHLAAAVALAVVGCGARVFWAYSVYQVYTTLGKLLAFPEAEGPVWVSDMIGDIVEFAAGLGFAVALGVYGRVRLGGPVERACSWRGILAGLGALTLVWLVFFVRSL